MQACVIDYSMCVCNLVNLLSVCGLHSYTASEQMQVVTENYPRRFMELTGCEHTHALTCILLYSELGPTHCEEPCTKTENVRSPD